MQEARIQADQCFQKSQVKAFTEGSSTVDCICFFSSDAAATGGKPTAVPAEQWMGGVEKRVGER